MQETKEENEDSNEEVAKLN